DDGAVVQLCDRVGIDVGGDENQLVSGLQSISGQCLEDEPEVGIIGELRLVLQPAERLFNERAPVDAGLAALRRFVVDENEGAAEGHARLVLYAGVGREEMAEELGLLGFAKSPLPLLGER